MTNDKTFYKKEKGRLILEEKRKVLNEIESAKSTIEQANKQINHAKIKLEINGHLLIMLDKLEEQV